MGLFMVIVLNSLIPYTRCLSSQLAFRMDSGFILPVSHRSHLHAPLQSCYQAFHYLSYPATSQCVSFSFLFYPVNSFLHFAVYYYYFCISFFTVLFPCSNFSAGIKGLLSFGPNTTSQVNFSLLYYFSSRENN